MIVFYVILAILTALYARICWRTVGNPDIRLDAMARNGLQFAVPVFLMSTGAAAYWGYRWLNG